MAKIKKKTQRYILGLDGFRTIGVLGIIFYHLFPQKVTGGYLGVTLFFLLSGYLLTDHLRNEFKQSNTVNIGAYFKRRIKSLYPMLLVMFLFSLSYMFFFQKNLLAKAQGAVISSLLMVNNWWQVLNGSSYFDRFSNKSPFTHLWFLGVEAQLYILLPILLFIFYQLFKRENGKKFLSFFVLSLLSAFLLGLFFSPENANRSYYGTDTRAFSFFIGSMIAFIWPSMRLKASVTKEARILFNSVGVVSGLMLVASFFLFSDQSKFIYYGGMYLFTLVGALFLMMIVHPGGSLGKWFNGKIFRYIGRRSYGIYLFQYPVMIFYEEKINVADHSFIHGIIELVLILLVTEVAYTFLQQFQRPRKITPFLVAGLLGLGFFGVSVYGLVTESKPVLNEDQSHLQEVLDKNKDLIDQDTTTATSTEATTESSEVAFDPTIIGEKYNLTTSQVEKAQKLSVTAIGDSVLLSAAEDFLEVFPKSNVDGEIGRQEYRSAPVIKELADKGQLKDTVIMALGTNGAFSTSQFAEVMDAIGKRRVYWINVYTPSDRWQNDVNTTLNEMAKKYDNLTIIDWYSLASKNPTWFYDDQVHPKPEGVKYYLKLIVDNVVK